MAKLWLYFLWIYLSHAKMPQTNLGPTICLRLTSDSVSSKIIQIQTKQYKDCEGQWCFLALQSAKLSRKDTKTQVKDNFNIVNYLQNIDIENYITTTTVNNLRRLCMTL